MDSERRSVTIGVLGVLIVGASVPVTGMLDGYPVITGQALRYALAGVLLLAWARLRGRPLPRPGPRDLPSLIALAATGMIGFQACLLFAQRYAEPGLVAAFLGGTPLVLALVGPLAKGKRPSWAPVTGAVLAGLGIAVLSGGGAARWQGLVLAALAMICEALFTLLAVGVLERLGPLATATWSCCAAGIGGAVVGTIADPSGAWAWPDGRELIALGYLTVVVTAIAFLLWYSAVSVLGADRAGVLVGLMPVSGLGVSLLLGMQDFRLSQVIGIALVSSGVVIGLRRREFGEPGALEAEVFHDVAADDRDHDRAHRSGERDLLDELRPAVDRGHGQREIHGTEGNRLADGDLAVLDQGSDRERLGDP
ncbi:drug/metabolite transporter (DMT)-like permease [Amycolatopsis umgeniensis]|uniref:Drug/metabolite transporter (DMT)-like permease n=1 Tax=Amycolatopsis umgeniensis TaxID=336628 RepID=A0A841AV67_9PSEU|nr:DMT family transporter [Amycolatopsis umgeniensis]MBB5852779.1 drug/metabolite transporter (DMT)-like permease [Amycolatopsis umgeniensis]